MWQKGGEKSHFINKFFHFLLYNPCEWSYMYRRLHKKELFLCRVGISKKFLVYDDNKAFEL